MTMELEIGNNIQIENGKAETFVYPLNIVLARWKIKADLAGSVEAKEWIWAAIWRSINPYHFYFILKDPFIIFRYVI